MAKLRLIDTLLICAVLLSAGLAGPGALIATATAVLIAGAAILALRARASEQGR